MSQGLAGGVAGGLFGIASTGMNYALNKHLQRKQHKFAERMARHSYRYAVEDLQAAGLNPILAVGGQAPAPQGASASVGQSDVVGSAIAGAKLAQELKLLKAQQRSANADVSMKNAKAAADQAIAYNTALQNRILQTRDVPAASAVGKMFSDKAKVPIPGIDISVGELLKWLEVWRQSSK